MCGQKGPLRLPEEEPGAALAAAETVLATNLGAVTAGRWNLGAVTAGRWMGALGHVQNGC